MESVSKRRQITMIRTILTKKIQEKRMLGELSTFWKSSAQLSLRRIKRSMSSKESSNDFTRLKSRSSCRSRLCKMN